MNTKEKQKAIIELIRNLIPKLPTQFCEAPPLIGWELAVDEHTHTFPEADDCEDVYLGEYENEQVWIAQSDLDDILYNN